MLQRSITAMMKPFLKFLSFIHFSSCIVTALTLLLYACASPRMPEGGPKDTIPPQLVETYPPNGSILFKDNKIVLTFDKEIDVRGIYNQLVITPSLKKPKNKPSYKYKIKKARSIHITLNSPLEDSTTYTFNFREAIRDITEGNIAKNPVVAFSTTDYIDTMYVAGVVYYLMSNQPADNTLVALYRANNDTLDIFNNPPDYFTRTDKEGNFKINYVKKGRYRIFASHNEKDILTTNPQTEAYGFLKDTLNLIEPRKDIVIPILKVDVSDFKLQTKRAEGEYFEISFSKSVVDYTLTLLYKPRRFRTMPTLYSNLVENGQTIRVYNTLDLLEEDIVRAKLTAMDTIGNRINDTIDIQFRESSRSKEALKASFQPPSGTKIDPYFVGTLSLNKPIKSVTTDSLLFALDSLPIVKIDEENLSFSAHRDTVTIKKQLNPEMIASILQAKNKDNPGTSLGFYMAKGAFITVEKDSSEAISHKYAFKNPKELGVIQGQVTTNAPGFIIQLLDKDYQVVDEMRNKKHYQFSDVPPGSYQVRVLVLKDKDAEWSFGNIKKLEEPDPVIFYPSEIAVRANWEIAHIDFTF